MKHRKIFIIIIFFLFIALITAAMNPYLIPGFYDNALYYLLGKSLSSGGGYQIQGQYIVDWPPVFPTILAFVFTIFTPSFLAAKITSAIFAVIGLTLTYRLLTVENRPYPPLTILFMSLLPTSILMATRIAPEWIFISLTFAFLLSVEKRTPSLLLLAGVFLGLASLTRYIGVLLGAALIGQCVLIYSREGKDNFFQKITPQVIAACIGATMFLGWIYWMTSHFLDGNSVMQTGNYEKYGFSIFSHFSLTRLITKFSDLLFQSENISYKYYYLGKMLIGITYFLFFFMVIGFIRLIREKRLHASDFYVVATLFALACYQWKISRYFLPLFPFLFSYLIEGGDLVLRYVSPLVKKRTLLLVKIGALFWATFIVSINGYLIIKGNNSEFNGLSPMISTSETEFYKNKWKDVYTISREIPKTTEDGEQFIEIPSKYAKFSKYAEAWSRYQIIVAPTLEDNKQQ